MNLKDQFQTLWYQAGSLGVVALVCSGALATASQVTSPAIQAAESRDTQNTLAQVLPEGFADNDLLADTVEITGVNGKPVKVYRARKGGQTQGVVFKTFGKGYGGEIIVMMGVSATGEILGVRVVKHTETPGLGDKIETAKSNWVMDFNGKSFSNLPPARWAVKKDGGEFDQFAGATITPRGVVKAVRAGLELFEKERSTMLGEAAPTKVAAPTQGEGSKS